MTSERAEDGPLRSVLRAVSRWDKAWHAVSDAVNSDDPGRNSREANDRARRDFEAAEAALHKVGFHADGLLAVARGGPPEPGPAIDPLREAADHVAAALRFHNKTPEGAIRPCLPRCVACAALEEYAALRDKS